MSPTPVVSTQSPTPDLAALGRQYLAAVAPYNAALDTFKKRYRNGFTLSQLHSGITHALADALQQFDSAILRLPWPQQVLPDVRALAAADAVELGDLHNAVNATDGPTWARQATADIDMANEAANILRADIGLPPPPS